MGVPQVVAYMTMAGLPAHYGLYACLAGGVYAAFGSCYCLSVGPSAVLSLLLREGLKRTVPSDADDGGPKYRQAAIQVRRGPPPAPPAVPLRAARVEVRSS